MYTCFKRSSHLLLDPPPDLMYCMQLRFHFDSAYLSGRTREVLHRALTACSTGKRSQKGTLSEAFSKAKEVSVNGTVLNLEY